MSKFRKNAIVILCILFLATVLAFVGAVGAGFGTISAKAERTSADIGGVWATWENPNIKVVKESDGVSILSTGTEGGAQYADTAKPEFALDYEDLLIMFEVVDPQNVEIIYFQFGESGYYIVEFHNEGDKCFAGVKSDKAPEGMEFICDTVEVPQFFTGDPITVRYSTAEEAFAINGIPLINNTDENGRFGLGATTLYFKLQTKPAVADAGIKVTAIQGKDPSNPPVKPSKEKINISNYVRVDNRNNYVVSSDKNAITVMTSNSREDDSECVSFVNPYSAQDFSCQFTPVGDWKDDYPTAIGTVFTCDNGGLLSVYIRHWGIVQVFYYESGWENSSNLLTTDFGFVPNIFWYKTYEIRYRSGDGLYVEPAPGQDTGGVLGGKLVQSEESKQIKDLSTLTFNEQEGNTYVMLKLVSSGAGETHGVAINSINGQPFETEVVEEEYLTQYPYWDEDNEPDYTAMFTNSGMVPLNVGKGVAVRTTDMGWQNFAVYSGGKGALQGLILLHDGFSMTYHAVTPNKIDAADIWLKSADSSVYLCVRLTNIGSAYWGAIVYDYNGAGFPLIGLLEGIPAAEVNRGQFDIEFGYSQENKISSIRVNGYLIETVQHDMYPNGYKDVTFGRSGANGQANVRFGFGVQADSSMDQDELLVLGAVDGYTLDQWVPAPYVSYLDKWTSGENSSLQDAADGLQATVIGELAGFGYTSEFDALTELDYPQTVQTAHNGYAWHNIKNFSIGLRLGDAVNEVRLQLFGIDGSVPAQTKAINLCVCIKRENGGAKATVLLNDRTIGALSLSDSSDSFTIAYASEDKVLSVNGKAVELSDTTFAFQFNNARINIWASAFGNSDNSVFVTSVNGEELRYYSPAPNYIKPYDPDYNPVNDWVSDPYNATNGINTYMDNVNGNSTAYVMHYDGAWGGIWGRVPLSAVSSVQNPTGPANFLSVFLAVGKNNLTADGMGIALADSNDGNFIVKDNTLNLKSGIIVRLRSDGTGVSLFDSSWARIGEANISGSFDDPELNGFLIEYDYVSKQLYVNGTRINADFSRYSFGSGTTYLGVFGTAQNGTESTVLVRMLNSEPVIDGVKVTIPEYPDLDSERVREQTEFLDPSPAPDYTGEFEKSTQTETRKETVEVPDSGCVGVIGVESGLMLAASMLIAALLISVRRRKDR